MATTGTTQGDNSRRRLPKLPSTNPVGASSDETPRPATSDESARQRRRNKQQLARQHTPDGRQSSSPSRTKELPLPLRTEQLDERQTTKRRKARRRVKSSSQLQPEHSLLQGFEDEVIIERSKKSTELLLPDLLLSSSHAAGTISKSAATPRIYFEEKKKISSVNKDDAVVRFGNQPGLSGYDNNYTFQQQTAEILKRYTVQVAKQTHAALQKFFLFIHGINSGYALWICVFVFVFTNVDPTNFFNVYRTIALITHLLFYLFLAISMVDLLDRIDPIKFNRTQLRGSLPAVVCAFAFVFYAVAMVVNLVMMKTEDYLRMTQYGNSQTNETLTVADVVSNQMDTWRNLVAVRAVFILAAWAIVSIYVKHDRLSTMIKNTEEKAFYEEFQIEQNTLPVLGGGSSA